MKMFTCFYTNGIPEVDNVVGTQLLKYTGNKWRDTASGKVIRLNENKANNCQQHV